MQVSRREWLAALAAWATSRGQAAPAELPMRLAEIGGGVALHYLEAGRGEPLIFVHGSLSDLSYWSDQVGPFSERFRTLAYSRRYNYPNKNPAIQGYSAIVDAQDLAALIETLKLGPCHIVGHSYGAFTGLFLGATRPELVRTLTLAEAPAMSLLQHVPAPHSEEGRALFADVNARMVEPMRLAFREGRREDGVRIFIDYVKERQGAWASFSPEAKTETLRNAIEWEVMMPNGVLFPSIAPASVRRIRQPTLLLSGAKSYAFLGLIDDALLALLPNRRRILFPRADHQMWLEEPDACRAAVFELAGAKRASSPITPVS